MPPRQQPAIVVTCEHAGNAVPPEYAALFAAEPGFLATHRGWDPGALGAAERFAATFGAPLVVHRYTRLLMDANRSLHHRAVFSRFTAGLSREEKAAIAAAYWQPFREAARRAIDGAIAARGSVLHLSIHSFTPELNGEVRNADLGLLYDPKFPREKATCASWLRAFRAAAPDLRARLNYPYRGASDGHVTALRRALGPGRYAGVEVEFNHGLLATPDRWEQLVAATIASLGTALSA